MPRRKLVTRIVVIVAATVLATGCARLSALDPAPELVDLEAMAQRGLGRLVVNGYSPGWVQLSVQSSATAKPFNAAVPAGRILISQSDPKLAYLILAGATVPATRSSSRSVLVPVVSLSPRMDGSTDLSRRTKSASTSAASSYKLDDSLMRAELFEIAAAVSSPERKWRPTQKSAIVAPHDARHLKRSVFAASEQEWARARDFFSERTPIQLAVWMPLYDFNQAQLERELVVYGPGMQVISGPARQEAIRATVADTFALWVSMGYDPDSTENRPQLASDYPDLARQAKANRNAATLGDVFPGSDSHLRPIKLADAGNPLLLFEEALLVKADFAP